MLACETTIGAGGAICDTNGQATSAAAELHDESEIALRGRGPVTVMSAIKCATGLSGMSYLEVDPPTCRML